MRIASIVKIEPARTVSVLCPYCQAEGHTKIERVAMQMNERWTTKVCWYCFNEFEVRLSDKEIANYERDSANAGEDSPC